MDLKNIQWGEFFVANLFHIERGTRLTKSNRIKGNIPLITAGFINIGVAELISNIEQKSFSNAITIDMFGNVFYREYDFKCDDNIHVLTNKLLNAQNGNFICSCLKKSTGEIYNYGKQFRLKTLEKLKIQLPINSQGYPNYAFMEQYMHQKEQEKLEKFKNFISTRIEEVKDYNEILPLNQKEWGEFFIEDVAQIISGRDIYETERRKGNTPYVSATANNNGVGYFVGNTNETLEENCLSVNRNGSVGYSFYHSYKALFSNDCRKLRLKHNSVNVGRFIARTITNQKEKYGYGYKMGTGRIKRQKILLPIDTTGQPDYEYMENYIKRLEYKKLSQYLDYLTKKH